MSDLLPWMGEHPVLTFVLAWMVIWLLSLPFQLINRFIRHRNIVAHGWPPPHCDADGDPRNVEVEVQ